ncbi:hypothetical protein HMPREF1051_1263 [Neisseria sicca VK64]|uniref:Uncharacterized protein n=1 Tax=Neisseria sicca VK64 TaxID=1095748 RepID=I2NX46_NEISI|nr:hypothetical protein HMPREF1051_1263 [Neisseria sicca VK64]
MLKRRYPHLIRANLNQPPLGGCVLKHSDNPTSPPDRRQPPLGGCVLKQFFSHLFHLNLSSRL